MFMDKIKYNDVLNKVLITGLNSRYSSVSTRVSDKSRDELFELLIKEPSILEHGAEINQRIIDVIFDSCKLEIMSYLRKNFKKIHQNRGDK